MLIYLIFPAALLNFVGRRALTVIYARGSFLEGFEESFRTRKVIANLKPYDYGGFFIHIFLI